MKSKKFSFILFSLIIAFMFSFNSSIFAAKSSFASKTDITARSNIISKSALENLPARSFILIDGNSGTVLAEKNADEPQSVASLVKTMTMLLIAEKIDEGIVSLDDIVNISVKAHKTPGSKIWLDPKEKLTVRELLKSIALNSANDSCVAIAELLAGSEEAFVDLMNEKALKLGLQDADKKKVFVNATGLDDDLSPDSKDGSLTSRDVAIIVREFLKKHPWILEYTSTYQDAISRPLLKDKEPTSNGMFPLTNTNKMVRSYENCTGFKTGTTDKAGECLSVTAERDNMQLIAVSLGSAINSGDRFYVCSSLLDYGFANWENITFDLKSEIPSSVPVKRSLTSSISVGIERDSVNLIVKKSSRQEIEKEVVVDESLTAPVEKGQVVGSVEFFSEGEKIEKCDLVAQEDAKEINFFSVFGAFFKSLFCGVSF